ncbi:phage tail tube protein [Aestuariibius sp. 2305UL40-4]|uniref:phage tail tube protein n=1 Tax=Aestuariibius violaceus TaxID=3234132 RepID=UPI00345E5639
MAAPELTGSFLILLGDGGSPETFGFPCGANARSVSLTTNTGEEALLDCDDPLGLPSAVYRWIESADTGVSISGRTAVQFFPQWRMWADQPDGSRNIRIEALNTVQLGGGSWALPAILSDLEFASEGKGTMTFNATIQGAGPRVWTGAV